MAGHSGPPTVAVGGPKKFRPRPIDPYRPVPILKDEKEERQGSDTTKPASKVESEQETSKDKKEAVNKSSAPSKSQSTVPKPTSAIGAQAKFNIPAPISEAESSYFDVVPSNFVVSSAYIRFRSQRDDDYVLSDDVEYELMIEDMQWLEKWDQSKHPSDAPKLTEDLLEQLIDILEKATARELPVQKERAVKVTFPSKLKLSVSDAKSWESVLAEVHDYWMVRRQQANKPLLRRFWPVTAADDPNPHATFRPREKERYKLRKKRENNIEAYEKLKQLEKDFMRVQQILDLVQRREIIGKKKVELIQDRFEEMVYQAVKGGNDPPRKRLVETIDDIEGPLVLSDVEDEVIEVPTARVDDQLTEAEIAKKEAEIEQLKQSLGMKKSKKLSKKKQKEEKRRLELEAKLAAKEAMKEGKKEKRKYKKKKSGDGVGDDRIDDENRDINKPVVPAELELPPSFLLPAKLFPQRPVFSVPRPPPLPTVSRSKPWRQAPARPVPAGLQDNADFVKRVVRQKYPATKYRCRGRVGRGGRYIIDRIPVPRPGDNRYGDARGPSRKPSKEAPFELSDWPQYITPEAYLSHGMQPAILFRGDPNYSTESQDQATETERTNSTPHDTATTAGSDRQNSTTTRSSAPVPPMQCFMDPAEMCDTRTAFRMKKLTASSMAKVSQLYAMSDSEDEEVVPFDNPTSTALLTFNYKPKFQFIC